MRTHSPGQSNGGGKHQFNEHVDVFVFRVTTAIRLAVCFCIFTFCTIFPIIVRYHRDRLLTVQLGHVLKKNKNILEHFHQI